MSRIELVVTHRVPLASVLVLLFGLLGHRHHDHENSWIEVRHQRRPRTGDRRTFRHVEFHVGPPANLDRRHDRTVAPTGPENVVHVAGYSIDRPGDAVRGGITDHHHPRSPIETFEVVDGLPNRGCEFGRIRSHHHRDLIVASIDVGEFTLQSIVHRTIPDEQRNSGERIGEVARISGHNSERPLHEFGMFEKRRRPTFSDQTAQKDSFGCADRQHDEVGLTAFELTPRHDIERFTTIEDVARRTNRTSGLSQIDDVGVHVVRQRRGDFIGATSATADDHDSQVDFGVGCVRSGLNVGDRSRSVTEGHDLIRCVESGQHDPRGSRDSRHENRRGRQSDQTCSSRSAWSREHASTPNRILDPAGRCGCTCERRDDAHNVQLPAGESHAIGVERNDDRPMEHIDAVTDLPDPNEWTERQKPMKGTGNQCPDDQCRRDDREGRQPTAVQPIIGGRHRDDEESEGD